MNFGFRVEKIGFMSLIFESCIDGVLILVCERLVIMIFFRVFVNV